MPDTNVISSDLSCDEIVNVKTNFDVKQKHSSSNCYNEKKNSGSQSKMQSTSMRNSSKGSPEKRVGCEKSAGNDRNVNNSEKHIVVINVNCRSICSQKKSVDLVSLIKEHNADVVIGTESWLNSDIADSEVFPQNFAVQRRDRQNRVGGGVFIACHESLQCNRENDLETECEILWCSVQIANGTKVLLGSFYRPPDTGEDYMVSFYDSMAKAKDKFRSAKVLCGGDYNLPDIDWTSDTVCCAGNRYTVQSKILLECINNFGLEQIVTVPTRSCTVNGVTSSSILDLLLTDSPHLVENVKVAQGISDHEVVVCNFQCRPSVKEKVKRKVHCYSKADFKVISSELADKYSEFKVGFSSRSVDENWNLFSQAIQLVVADNVPVKSVKVNGDPAWYNKDCSKAEAKQRRLHSKAKRTKSESDWNAYKEACRVARQKNRAAHKDYVDKLGESLKGDTKAFWRYVKSKRKGDIGISCLKNKDDEEVRDPLSKANALNEQFQSVFTSECDDNMPGTVIKCDVRMNPISVTYNGVVKLLKNLDVKKAAGPDGISNKLLKGSADVVALFLVDIFNQSLAEGFVPTEWKKALVCPISKGGNKSDPANYRPISLTCVCCKILEHIIVTSIMQHVDRNNLLSSNQHGFRKGLSCETQLVMLTEILAKSLDEKCSVDVIFLDFSKAFDRVPHRRLLYKLEAYNLDRNVLRWISSFVSNREQRVVLEGDKSNPVSVTSGVPQGSVLGPLLFLMYINDISEQLSCDVRLFADDCVLYSRVDSDEDHSERLCHAVRGVEEWCDKWLMKLNVKKCAVMRVSRRKEVKEPCYVIGAEKVEVVDEYKYLGVKLTSTLSWNNQVESVLSKANKNLRFVKRVFKDSPQQVKETVYKSLVRPLVEYACTVWDPNPGSGQSHDLEMVQHRAARFTLNRYGREDSVTQMLSELEWPTLECRRQVARLTLFYKMYCNIIPLDVSTVVTPPAHIGVRDHRCKVNRVPSRCLSYHMSFFPRTIRDWNSLSSDIVQSETVGTFRQSCKELFRSIDV